MADSVFTELGNAIGGALQDIKYSERELALVGDVTGKATINGVDNIVINTTASITIDGYTKVEVEDRFNNVLNITNGLNENKVDWEQYTADMAQIQTALETLSGYHIDEAGIVISDNFGQQELKQLKTKAYLNGGYKASVVQQKRCQRFSSVTETGGDLGYVATISASYRPGGSTKDYGYFFGSPTVSGSSSVDGKSIDKIGYISEAVSNVTTGGLGFSVYGSLYDINVQSAAWGTDGSNWMKIAAGTHAISTLASATATAHSRQMLSSETFGIAKNASSVQYKYTYATGTSASFGSAFTVSNIPAGLVKDKTGGYWIGYTNTNFYVNFTTLATSNVSCFTYNMGESNTLGTETHGYALGGYNGSVQHAVVQKMDWATQTASTVLGGDLSFAQSSAACCEA